MNSIRADIEAQLKESSRVLVEMHKLSETIEKASRLLIDTIKGGGKVLLCGNGGSAADCQHIAAEIVGRYKLNRPAMAAVALTTDTSILTAVSNDLSFDDIFSRQVEALGRPGDSLLAISTSGHSPNVLAAVEKAGEMEMKTLGLTGRNNSPLADRCDIAIQIPSSDTPRVQEGHIAVGHILSDLIEKHFYAGHT